MEIMKQQIKSRSIFLYQLQSEAEEQNSENIKIITICFSNKKAVLFFHNQILRIKTVCTYDQSIYMYIFMILNIYIYIYYMTYYAKLMHPLVFIPCINCTSVYTVSNITHKNQNLKNLKL